MTDWSKVGRKSRSKGQRFERKIAKLLTKFSREEWRRTPASGGMQWKGDVICPRLGIGQRIIVECKDRYIWLEPELLDGFKTLKSWLIEYDNSDSVVVLFTTKYPGTTLAAVHSSRWQGSFHRLNKLAKFWAVDGCSLTWVFDLDSALKLVIENTTAIGGLVDGKEKGKNSVRRRVQGNNARSGRKSNETGQTQPLRGRGLV